MIQLAHLSQPELMARLEHLRAGVDEIAAILGESTQPAARRASRALSVLLGENEGHTHTLPRPILVKDIPEIAEALMPRPESWAKVQTIGRRKNDG